MIRWRGLSALAALLALATPAAMRATPSRAATAVPATADRQILVMLKLSPDHLRAGGAYGGGYGDSTTGAIRQRTAERIARRHGLSLDQKGWPMPLMGIDCYVMRVPSGMSIDAAIAAVSQDGEVAWSQPMQVYRAQGGGPSTDPLFAAQPAAGLWHLADLHRYETGRGVTVAVIDSRVDARHPDLDGQISAERDFTTGRESGPERHGTAVAGVIAAREGNGVGIVGVAPQARLMALRACWQTADEAAAPTLCDTLSLAQALQFAILHNAAVINMSLSGPPDLLLERLIAIAGRRMITVVAAYDPVLPKGGFPASAPGVVAVAAMGLASGVSGVYRAPGNDILTTQPGGKWLLVDGSSFAAAHVSGLIALVRQAHADPHASLAVDRRSGAIDACATLAKAGPCPCNCGSPAEAHGL